MHPLEPGIEDATESSAVKAKVQASSRTPKSLAQGVQCGAFALAFGFDWASQIVDQFELVPIPRAPAWVLGAANVSGLIVPVVDVANYFSESAAPAQLQRGQRLLIGGVQNEDSDSAFAVVFSQTPVQLEYEAQPFDDLDALPLRLQEVCKGIVHGEKGVTYFEIDPQRLMNALSAELSVI